MIPLADAMTIAAVAAITPVMIFFVLMLDPPIEISRTSLAGLSLFCAGALLASAGRSLGSRAAPA